MNYKKVYDLKYVDASEHEKEIQAKYGPSFIDNHIIDVNYESKTITSFEFNSPNPCVILDRDVYISGKFNFSLKVKISEEDARRMEGEPVLGFGKDFFLCDYPLNSMFRWSTVKIGDVSYTSNLFNGLLCSWLLTLQNNNEEEFNFCGPNQTLFHSLDKSYTDSLGEKILLNNRVPVISATKTEYEIYFYFKTKEKLLINPFIADDYNDQTDANQGIANFKNLIVNLSYKEDFSDIIRYYGEGRHVSDIKFIKTIHQPKLHITNQIPHSSLKLPDKCVYEHPSVYVLYKELPIDPLDKYKFSFSNKVIPYKMEIYLKKKSSETREGKYFMPIEELSLDMGYIKTDIVNTLSYSTPIIIMPGIDIPLQHNEFPNKSQNININITVKPVTDKPYDGVLYVKIFTLERLITTEDDDMCIKGY